MATTMASMAGREMTIGGVVARAFAAVGAAPAVFFGTSFLLVALPSLALRLLTFGVVQTGVPATRSPASAGGCSRRAGSAGGCCISPRRRC